MATAKKGETRVDGRRRRSMKTRSAIAEAAVRCFLERGYLTSTIEDVANEAGVAVQTVYYVFGTKPKLLSAALDASIAGDTEPNPLVDRAWIDALQSAPDATSAIARFVEFSVDVVVRTSPLYHVVRRAASDPDVGALLDETRRRRRLDQQQLIRVLADAGHVHHGIDTTRAADVVYGLINEETFDLLVGDCGWSEPQYRTWLTEVISDQLLGSRPET